MINISRALIIKEPHIDRILSGLKTWEIRGSNTKVRGLIGLIQSGTGLIIGTAELVDSIPLTRHLLQKHFDRHQAPPDMITYPRPYAWVLKGATRLSTPIPYTHKQGAIIWVKV